MRYNRFSFQAVGSIPSVTFPSWRRRVRIIEREKRSPGR